MNNNRRSNVPTFIDLLFTVILGLAAMYMLQILLINPVKNKSIDSRAVMLVVVTWDDKSADDVDVWVRNPHGAVVNWKGRDKKTFFLDRDDLGKTNDTIILPDGKRKIIRINRETVTFRTHIPGRYTVNLNMYKKVDSTPTNVTVEVIRVSPYLVIHKSSYKMTVVGEELTAINFNITKTGKILNSDTIQYRLVK